MEKICNVCRQSKPLALFLKDCTRKDGYGYRCKECQKSYSKTHHKNNKESYKPSRKKHKDKIKKWYKKYKATLQCSLCEEKETSLLDFHHVETKNSGIAWMVACGESISKIQQEMQKCIVLCKSCHRKEHCP